MPKGKFVDVLIGDRDAWRPVPFVGRDDTDEPRVAPRQAIFVRPAVRLDPAPRPSLGNVLADAFDALGEGAEEALQSRFMRVGVPAIVFAIVAIGVVALILCQAWGPIVRGS